MVATAFRALSLLPSVAIILTAVAATEAASYVLPAATFSTTAQREFDYFTLALQWPGTYCRRTHRCCSSNGCCGLNPLTDFTIHGLWPDYYDGSYPSCCKDSDFDEKKISSLLPDLRKYWPSLSCGSSSLCHVGKGLFWAHEWEKHGTCSYPSLKDEYSYFAKALDLYLKYNITRILNNDGIFVGTDERYSVGTIISAIIKALGTMPFLECSHGSLQELRLCFDKDFKPRDCIVQTSIQGNDRVDYKITSRKSCPRSISLPTYSPLGNGDASLVISS
ncbi:hypothetical protein HPP92_003442 [Vanilla planifolia]|uniref:Uncharacterized protein n=1 Tax=Vanilla planifolia TaxID=51239 RepID=A0A835S2B0_VANPL|nr:hypothetical protein HPP92_003442 [Vanilla planifolia]